MKGGCIRTKVVVIGEKWFYSGKSGFIRAKWLYSGKSGSIPTKMVVFRKKWLCSAKWL